MEFYDEKRKQYLETETSGEGLGAGLLQVREGIKCQKDTAPNNSIIRSIAFVSKSLSNAETCYSNIEWEVLGILHGFQKIHHYCFAREVHVIIDHDPLVSIFETI